MTDIWSTKVPSILEPETIARIVASLDRAGPILIEHQYYRRAKGPTWHVFDEATDLLAYLREKATPGDLLRAWDLGTACHDGNSIACSKVPTPRASRQSADPIDCRRRP